MFIIKRTRLHLHRANGTASMVELLFKTGIFQGFKVGKIKVSHLFYIDSLKLYAQYEEEALQCKQLIQTFSDDIGMRFRLDKCTVLTIRKWKVVLTALMGGIPRLDDEEGYTSLGILKSSDEMHFL
eukprot:12527091-Ditylum_brightwellii.AAC.1